MPPRRRSVATEEDRRRNAEEDAAWSNTIDGTDGVDEGERSSAMDRFAQRDAERAERQRQEEEYANRDRLDPGTTDDFAPSDTDQALSYVPFDLFGARSRIEEATARTEAERNRGYWEHLNAAAPSVDDLFRGYDEEGYVDGMGSEWDAANDTDEARRGRGAMDDAMSALDGWAEGGLTDTDRAMMEENARGESMNARADREAALSAMEARGMGGSGGALAASLSAGEGAATRASAANTGMMAAAQQRQYNATRDAASLGGAMRDADARERSGREAYNTGETEYGRGLEGRNTATRNRAEDRRGDMTQQVYANREAAVSGVTNQYAGDAAGRRAAGDERDETDDAIGGIIQGFLAS